MSSENRELRVSVVADVQAARKVKTILTEVTSEAAKAYAALNRLNTGGPAGGGMNLPGSMGGGGADPRFGAKAQQNTGNTGGMMGGLVRNIQNQAQMLRAMGKGSTDAMKAMTDAVKQAQGLQRREMDQTIATIGRLEKQYDRMVRSMRSAAHGPIGGGGGMASGHAMDNTHTRNISGIGGYPVYPEATFGGGGGGGWRGGGGPPGFGWGGGNTGGPRGMDPNLMGAYGGKHLMQPGQIDGSGSSNGGMSAFTAAMMVKMIGQSVSQVGGGLQTMKGMSDVNAASTIATPTRILGELSRGSLRGLAQIQGDLGAGGPRLDGKDIGSVSEKYGGTGASLATRGGGVVADIGSALISGVTLGTAPGLGDAGRPSGGSGPRGTTTTGDLIGAGTGLVGNLKDAILGGKQLTNGGVQSDEARTIETGYMNRRALDPMREMTWDNMEAMAGARVASAKSLGGRHWEAAGKGMAGGLDFSQSTGIAEGLSRQFGLDLAMGVRGPSTPGRMVNDDKAQLAKMNDAAGYARKYRAEAQRLRSDSMSGGSSRGIAIHGENQRAIDMNMHEAKAQDAIVDGVMAGADANGHFGAKMVGGKSGKNRGVMDHAIHLQRMGMDVGAAGTMVGTMAMGEKGAGAPDAAMKQLEEVFARGFGKGIRQVRFFEEIGKSVAEGTFGGGGHVGGARERGQMLMAGLNGDSTMHDVESAQRGLRGMDDLLQNNPYFNMVKTSEAINVLGGKASGMDVRSMQQASIGDLVGGSDELKDAGISQSQRRRALSGSFKHMVGSFASDVNTPALMDALKSDDFAGALKNSPQAQKEAARALRGNTGIDYSAAKMQVAQISELGALDDDPAKWSKKQTADFARMNKGHGDNAENVIATQMKVLFETLKKEMEPAFRDAMVNASKSVPEALKAAAEAAQDPGSPDFQANNSYIIQVSSVKPAGLLDRLGLGGPKVK